MVDDTDGVGETFDNSLRIALTVASQFGERFARLREEWSRQREAAATQEARELQSRLDAERAAVRGQLSVVDQPSWWDRADVREAAVAWRDHDDVAARANNTIRREVHDRYGIDVDATGADPASVAGTLRSAEADRARTREEQRRSGEELAASRILLASAYARDRDADAAAERAHGSEYPAATAEAASREREAAAERSRAAGAFDSAERRAEFARSLEGTAPAEEVRGRVLANTGNAKSPREAVTPRKVSTPTARSTRATGQQRDRGGLAR